VLSILALGGVVLAGLALLIGFGAWRRVAATAACVSLVTIALFWGWKMMVGVAVDVGILVALLRAAWPGRDLVGS